MKRYWLIGAGSYWIQGSYASMLSENLNSFIRSLRNKDFKEEMMTKIGLYPIVKPTTLESNTSVDGKTLVNLESDRLTLHFHMHYIRPDLRNLGEGNLSLLPDFKCAR